MALVISPTLIEKLKSKHNVSRREVEQCFDNRTRGFLEDTREQHKSDPPTMWFIAETNQGRKLKVCFIHEHGNIYLRTAFEPSAKDLSLYDQLT